MQSARAPLRVAFVVDSLVVGGAERVVQATVQGLARAGHEVAVGCLREAGAIGLELGAAGVSVDTQLAPRRLDLLQIFELRRWLRAQRPDVVFVLDHSNALFYGRLAARSLGLPQITAIHRTRRADGSPSLGRIDRLLMSLSERIIAVSQGQARYLTEVEQLDAERVRVVANGIDPEEFVSDARQRAEIRGELDLSDERPALAIVAALRPEKNHEMLFEALARPSLSGLDLVIVGDGLRREALEARARRLGLAPRLRWLGWRGDVAKILAAVDGLVLPSHPNVETFPMCVLEAMAASLPVVATRVGSLDEMVVDTKTGWLIAPGDVDALEGALMHWIGDEAELAGCGRAGRERVVAKFDRDRMVQRFVEVLDEVTGPAGGKRR